MQPEDQKPQQPEIQPQQKPPIGPEPSPIQDSAPQPQFQQVDPGQIPVHPESNLVDQPVPTTGNAPNQIPNLNQSMAGGAPEKKSKTGLIVGIIVGISVLFLIFAGLFFVLVSNSVSKIQDEATSTKAKSDTSQSNKKNNAVTAKYASDYSAVCEGGSVLNAPAPVKPYLIETFFTNDARSSSSWVSQNIGYGESYHPDSKNPVSANVVACLSQKEDSEAKSKTCKFEEGADNKPVDIDFYSVEYELTYKEAKTGETIGSPSPINGPATNCPLFASYSKSNPKIYADPDKAALEVSHKAFAN